MGACLFNFDVKMWSKSSNKSPQSQKSSLRSSLKFFEEKCKYSVCIVCIYWGNIEEKCIYSGNIHCFAKVGDKLMSLTIFLFLN